MTGHLWARGRIAPLRTGLVVALLVASAGCNRRGGGGDPAYVEIGRSGGITRPATARDGDRTVMDRWDGGVCVLDADGVAPLDLFFPSRTLGGSALYVASAGGWTERSGSLGLGTIEDAMGCLAFDADGDADTDLLVLGVGHVDLYVRSGGGFVLRPLSMSVPSSYVYPSAAAGDLDGDGDLDVVVAGLLDALSFTPTLCDSDPCEASVSAYAGIPDLVLENQGGTFIDRTEALAPDLAETELTASVAIQDLDGDGSPEIFVGHVSDADDLWLASTGGIYRDVAASRGLSGPGRTTSVAIGDVDGDLDLDLALTGDVGEPSPVWVCAGGTACIERGASLGTSVTSMSTRWSNALFDADLDGDLDLLEVAGDVATAAEQPGAMPLERPIFLRQADGSWAQEAATSVVAAGRGLAVADLDDDGRLELVIGVTDGLPVVLGLPASSTTSGHFLRVVLAGPPGNPFAIGARVEVTQGTRTFVRVVRAGEGYASSSDPRVHVGLPDVTTTSVHVRWPDGSQSTVAAEVDTEVRVMHGTP